MLFNRVNGKSQLKFSHEKRSCDHGRFIVALDEHKQIIKALQSRDVESCVEAMKKHMANTLTSLKE